MFLGLDGRRHPNDKRSNQIVDWEGVDMIGGELALLVINVDDDYDYDGYKDVDEMMMVMMAIKYLDSGLDDERETYPMLV